MTSEAQKRAIKKYCDGNIRQIVLKLNVHKDADILDAFDAQASNVEFIRKLVREYLGGGSENE